MAFAMGRRAGRGRTRRRKEGWTKEEGKKGRQKRDAKGTPWSYPLTTTFHRTKTSTKKTSLIKKGKTPFRLLWCIADHRLADHVGRRARAVQAREALWKERTSGECKGERRTRTRFVPDCQVLPTPKNSCPFFQRRRSGLVALLPSLPLIKHLLIHATHNMAAPRRHVLGYTRAAHGAHRIPRRGKDDAHHKPCQRSIPAQVDRTTATRNHRQRAVRTGRRRSQHSGGVGTLWSTFQRSATNHRRMRVLHAKRRV